MKYKLSNNITEEDLNKQFEKIEKDLLEVDSNSSGLEKIWGSLVNLSYKEKVDKIEEVIKEKYPNEVVLPKKGRKVAYPSWTDYNHYFSSGLYIREMFCKKGAYIISALHGTANPLFIMKGSVIIANQDGGQELTGPRFVLTEIGTKRVIYFIEDSILINVHPNPKGLKDLKEVEDEIYCNNWDDLKNKEKNVWIMLDHKNTK